jgi:photosystem II stability/assembly factor-like uncharacterized protein
MTTALLVGTRKGLFVLTSADRESWDVSGPILKGWEVFHAIADPRDGALYAATNSFVYGGTVHRSEDRGETWTRAEELGLPEDTGLTLEKTWHVRPGRDAEDGRLWLGGAPGVLFRSDDSGQTWEAVDSLIGHETRDKWNPGAGGMCCHSIQLDPDDPNRMYVAISAAGTFRSEDGGGSWAPANSGVAADFFPDDPFPEVGQCVHKLLVHPASPARLWQQNHCGVYRSDDYGQNWERLEGNGLPSGFGFPIALDPSDPDVAYVIPEEGAENRVTPDGRLGVYRTRDGGASWELVPGGLPEPAWVAVLREASSFDDGGVFFGTQSGSVFATTNGGESWSEAATHLPPILSVEATSWQ